MNTTRKFAEPAPYPERHSLVRASRRTAYAAFGWVMVFLAWHIVWVGPHRRRLGLRAGRHRLSARVAPPGRAMTTAHRFRHFILRPSVNISAISN